MRKYKNPGNNWLLFQNIRKILIQEGYPTDSLMTFRARRQLKITAPLLYADIRSVGIRLCENSVNISSNLLCWQYTQLYLVPKGSDH